MYIRGRIMRQRYIENNKFLQSVFDPTEIYAYSTDEDRTYTSSLSFMTGLYPPGGPAPLWDNQTIVAVPPVPVDNIEQIKYNLGNYALEDNFQTVPIHSDSGDFVSMLYKGYDQSVCPIIGEIQNFELLNNQSIVNKTFTAYATNLYPLLQKTFNISGPPLDI